MQNLLEELKKLLEQDERLVVDGKLLKNKVIESALKLDVELIKLLLKNETIKKHFFQEADGVLVFDKIKFQKFVSNKAFLSDNWTSFKNKIGLVTENEEYLSESKEVVLAWPYKDCVLEGGMEKEDEKRNEIFYNEILAPDEIDRLLEPKVLTNFKRIDKNGEHSASVILSKAKNLDFSKDNLIIRGNNLLALHSLKKRFAGKVKLIYIDPPYNTGNDSFNYNDSFNHSTWLTFMKNRLVIAKDLLSFDGSIYVQLDYNEVHYFKVLMDEIFGRQNFQREIIWRIGWVSGYKTAIKNWIRNHDTILFYTKKDIFFNKEYIPYPEGYTRRDGAEPDGKGFPIEDTWNCSENDVLNSIQLESFNTEKTGFFTQKNEALLQRIINSATNIGETVLDFCSGSGTAAATAHKLGRRYIGIEQMEEQMKIIQERLVKVIGGENKGISKAVNWQGGGDFIYCELMKLNEKYIEEVKKAKNTKELLDIWETMKEKAFLSYKVDVKRFDENVAEFEQLSLENQKKFLIECLDKNLLYVSLSEIDDSEYEISKEDKELNKQFYEVK